MTRLFAQRFTQVLGQQFVVENAPAPRAPSAQLRRPAAAGRYTLLLATNSTYAIAPHLISPLPTTTAAPSPASAGGAHGAGALRASLVR